MPAATAAVRVRLIEGRTAPATLEELARWLELEHARLLRFAYLLSGDPHAAQDLVQTAFVRAFKAGVRIEPTTAAYFRRTMTNTWRSSLRRHSLEKAGWAQHPDAGVAPAPADPDPLWEAIKQLPTQQRAVLLLRYYEDLTERETAGVLGISLGSVKRHASRAIERLRTTFD